jgi:hypothetical protein
VSMFEGQADAVSGVDTDRDGHAAAVLDPNRGVRATREGQATGSAMSGCSGWPRSRPQVGGSGAGKGPGGLGRG